MGIVARQSAKNAPSREFELVLEELSKLFPDQTAPEGPAATPSEGLFQGTIDEPMADEDALLRTSV